MLRTLRLSICALSLCLSVSATGAMASGETGQQVGPRLSSDIVERTATGGTKKVWEYIKKNPLQDKAKKTSLR